MRHFATRTTRVPPLLLALIVLLLGELNAEARADDKDAKAKPKEAVGEKATPPPARVTDAYRNDRSKSKTVALGDEIVVEVENLGTLLKAAQSVSPPRKILLFLDGRPIEGASPFPPTDPDKSVLIFPLRRTEGSRDVWTHILGKPGWNPRHTDVSVGLKDAHPVESESKVELRVCREPWFGIWCAVFALLVVVFGWLAVSSDLLREPGTNTTTGRKPFSLSRTQAAWWFFIVIASYLFIGMITGDYGTTITGTVLVLIGISAGTVVGSAVIEAGKPESPAAAERAAALASEAARKAVETQAVLAKKDDALASIRLSAAAALPLPPANAAGKDEALTAIQQTAEKALEPAGTPAPKKRSCLRDILSDSDGVSFHRFQIAAWTLVLGIIFVAQVYEGLAMPTFDGSLLALMGISAGTYLGLKIPEPEGKPRNPA